MLHSQAAFHEGTGMIIQWVKLWDCDTSSYIRILLDLLERYLLPSGEQQTWRSVNSLLVFLPFSLSAYDLCFYSPAQAYALSSALSLAISPLQASMYKQKDIIKKQLFSPVILLQTIMPAPYHKWYRLFDITMVSFNFLVIIRNANNCFCWKKPHLKRNHQALVNRATAGLDLNAMSINSSFSRPLFT